LVVLTPCCDALMLSLYHMPLMSPMVSCASYYGLLTIVLPGSHCQVLFHLGGNSPMRYIPSHLRFSSAILLKYPLCIFVPLNAHTCLSLDLHDSCPQLSSYIHIIFHYNIILPSLSLYRTFRVLFINRKANSMCSDQSNCLPAIPFLASA